MNTNSQKVCSFETGADLGNAINGWHGSVHITIGGTMGSLAIASASPIFWCWHAFVDHIYYDWQFCQVVVPRLGMAKWRLKLAGLKVGSVMTLPFLFVRPEGFSLIREEPIDPRIAQTEMTPMVTSDGHEHGGHGHDASHEASTTWHCITFIAFFWSFGDRTR